MGLETKPFCCEQCGNCKEFIWKTRVGKLTELLTIFGLVMLGQLQVKCKRCGYKMYLVCRLWGVDLKTKVPQETVRKLGLLGALASYRVSKQIVGMFGWALDRMTIWCSVQRVGRGDSI